uniref:Uncharacterized protein n=1 Tax=viral metagenome TaxID=1070528 RepID=A0A6H1ZSF8_9ZZZZ
MRILGYSKRWDKLKKPVHTTFRYARKDKDWFESEIVQEVYKPRSKEREILQIATVVNKEPKLLADITHEEAVEDGFINLFQMFEWLSLNHKGKDMFKPINKLTLEVREYMRDKG